MGINKRAITKAQAVVIVAIVIGVIVAGVYFASRPTAPPLDGESWWAKAAEPYEGVELVMVGEELAPLEALAEITPEFEEETGISVSIEFLAEEEVFSRTMMDMISGAGTYSMIQGVHYNFGKFVEPGYLRPIDDLLESELLYPELELDDIMPLPWNETGFYDPKTGKYGEGNCYGIPFSTHCMISWYRKDLFTNPDEQTAFKAKYGYDIPVDGPKAWNQYYDLAEFFTRKKGETLAGKVLDEDFYGTLLQAKKHPALWYEWMNFQASYGGTFFDDNGNIAINSTENVESLEFYISLRSFCPPGITTYCWDEALAAMQQDMVATCIMWTDATYDMEDPTMSLVVGKMAYCLVPEVEVGQNRLRNAYGGYSWYIPKASKNPEAAFLFIQWASTKENCKGMALQGGIPGRISTWEDPEVLELPYAKPQAEALEYAVFSPCGPNALELLDTLTLGLSKAVLDEMSPKEALDWVAERWAEM
jgi:multiple sugar transport system substrate-binding protein